eukprot:TRINITY_DN6272_c2_g1_i1.p1 TRINITY_DN6272_c2_g1~~TRINITY_DN6272_c2_g1_i1.p1  ORF type:complete len:132 (-),score=12.55 TRINITY_DN6272_c2_g1_i1:185-580(-)
MSKQHVHGVQCSKKKKKKRRLSAAAAAAAVEDVLARFYCPPREPQHCCSILAAVNQMKQRKSYKVSASASHWLRDDGDGVVGCDGGEATIGGCVHPLACTAVGGGSTWRDGCPVVQPEKQAIQSQAGQVTA